MRADAVGLACIEACIYTSKLVWWGRCVWIQVDLLKINNVIGCREIHQDAGRNILYNSYSCESLQDAAGCGNRGPN
jgi:hypothetical protein